LAEDNFVNALIPFIGVSKLEIVFCVFWQKIISLSHLSPLVGIIPFIGVRSFING